MTMRLYFVRHGQAIEPQDWHGAEAARPLTAEGVAQMRLAAQGLASLIGNGSKPAAASERITHLFSSPYTRARQTADLVAEALGMSHAIAVEERTELASGCDFARLALLIAGNPDATRLIFVGHEPDLSDIIGALIAPDTHAVAHVEMKKGACCRVDLSSPHIPRGANAAHALASRGTLAWLLTAKQLARLAPPDS
ncbi:MAG: histidine phosphatase family protein [Ktedonobacterales bacterium]